MRISEGVAANYKKPNSFWIVPTLQREFQSRVSADWSTPTLPDFIFPTKQKQKLKKKKN